MEVCVRVAEDREADETRSVALDAHSVYEGIPSPRDWEKMKRGVSGIVEVASRGTLLVAGVEGRIAGAVVYLPPASPRPDIFEGEWSVTRMLSVSPGYGGQGIGRMLSEECVRRAENDRAGTIALDTGEMMVAARTIYQRLGFEAVREVEPRFGFRYLTRGAGQGGCGDHPRSREPSCEAMDPSCSRLVTSRASCSMRRVL